MDLQVHGVFTTHQELHTHYYTMAASQISLLLLLALLTLTASTSTAEPTIYEILSQFGFPPGVLPDSVHVYETIEAEENSYYFIIYLDKACYVKYDYLVHFDMEITGKITNGKITELRGLTALAFFIWLDIDEIKVVGNKLYFTVGLVTVSSNIALFETIPTCKDSAFAACDHSSKQTKLISQLPIIAE